jgi:hypothetical protein
MFVTFVNVSGMCFSPICEVNVVLCFVFFREEYNTKAVKTKINQFNQWGTLFLFIAYFLPHKIKVALKSCLWSYCD